MAIEHEVLVLPGDGIGKEVMSAALEVICKASKHVSATKIEYIHREAGAEVYLRSGQAITDEILETAGNVGAVLFGAMGLPNVRKPDGTEVAPQLDLRTHFHLISGVRPAKLLPNVPSPLRDDRAKHIDFVIIRESTEGLFADIKNGSVTDDSVARDALVITRPVCETLFEFAFELAEFRKNAGASGRVTCVDKVNVLKSMAFFRKVFIEVAKRHEEVLSDAKYIDAVALELVMKPWEFDIIVTENMFGDILSDLAAALVGGMGMAPSADIGEKVGVFQPCHGSAPDIVGKGIANPTAMILSAAMMFEWLGRTRHDEGCTTVAEVINKAVNDAYASGFIMPFEIGGTSTTADITRRILDCIGSPV